MLWVYALPTWIFVALAVVALSGGATLCHVALRRRGWRGFREHNDITGFILTIVGAIYAVVLGFVAVVVWEQYEGSRQNEQHEVNSLSSLYHMSLAFRPQTRARLRGEIGTYLRIVVDDEWAKMRDGGESRDASDAASQIVDTVIGLQKNTFNPSVAVETLGIARTFMDARRQRLQDNSSGIPPLLWVVLLGGAAITIGFGYLFGIENLRFHATSTACTAAIIALMLALVARLDYPFRGDSGIPVTDFAVAAHALPR